MAGDSDYITLIEYIKPYIRPCFEYKCNLDRYKPLAGEDKKDIKIKKSKGHYEWIIAKRKEGLTTIEIADEFYKQFGFTVCYGSISNVLKKTICSDGVPLNKGYKRKQSSKDKQKISMRMISRTKIKGVHKNKNSRYGASFGYDSKVFNCGWFDTVEEAAKNYDYHVLKLYGKDNCYLNYPDFDYSTFVPLMETPKERIRLKLDLIKKQVEKIDQNGIPIKETRWFTETNDGFDGSSQGYGFKSIKSLYKSYFVFKNQKNNET